MKFSFLFSFAIYFVSFIFSLDAYISLALSITGYLGSDLFFKMSRKLAFSEFFIFLYAINYLLSPAIAYQVNQQLFLYKMKIASDQYFSIIIPAFFFLLIGTYFFKTSIFKPNFSLVKFKALINENVLRQWLLLGIFLHLIQPYFSTGFGFFIYLASLIRYTAIFSLYALNRFKYRWYLVLVLGLEIFSSIKGGMFHDTMMWLIFFIIFVSYAYRYDLRLKFFFSGILFVLFFFLQNVKTEYRSRTWQGEEVAGINTFLGSSAIVFQESKESSILGEINLIGSLTRVNQAWIFASVVERMDRIRDFQDLNVLKVYLESAFLPRFLAPDKLKSGDRDIFNRFSGHTINRGTSMGLGIFSDGYIAFGVWGVWIFAFFFGLLFSIVFKIVESWSTISPFFVLFIFPILNYAVRPDCELQTILGHLVKSVLVFGVFISFYRRYFERHIEFSQRLESE